MGNELTISLDNLITDASSGFATTLAQYKWDLLPDSQLQAAKKALMKSDYIMKTAMADPESVHDALIQSAVLGLDLTEGKRQGWLLPRKNQQGKTVVCLQVGYKGVEAIHQRMGVIDRLSVRVVRENDTFEWSGDDQEKPKHEANWFQTDEERGAISGAFAVTYYPDKSINVTVASISEIFTKHRDVADSWKSYQHKVKSGANAYPPPWATNEKAMVEKTMAFIASKQWPANIRDSGVSSKILETLHNVDTADYVYMREQICPDPIDRAKVSAATKYLKEQIDLDTIEDTHAVIKHAWSRLTNDEKMAVADGMREKAPDSNKMYKSLLKEYLNYEEIINEQ